MKTRAKDETMKIKDIVAQAQAAGVKLIRFEYCDVSGVARSKAVHISQLEKKLVEGVNLTRAQMSINLLETMVDIKGMEPVGEIRVVPDVDTFRILPWANSSAAVLCDQLDHDRQDWGACPRSFLKKVIAKAAAMGIGFESSFENEYYLAREADGAYVPFDFVDHSPVYSPIGHDLNADIMVETTDALVAQGMVPEQAINEYGRGQQEIAIRYAEALTCADNQMRFRDTVRGVALRHGLLASFAPKPFPDEIGSGAHIHFSLWSLDGKRNLLFDPDAEGNLSAMGRHFVAGVCEHLPALVALTAPSYNSYRRLQPSAWASATTAWGFDNKEVAMRVVSPFWGREEQSFNIEFKPSDASANPYLSLGGLIAAGLDGIERQLEPGAPCERDPARLSADELTRGKVRNLPTTMHDALVNLSGDTYLLNLMGDLLSRCYLAVRGSEADTFAARDVDYEIHQHFYRF
jgi:glutamine synthetase